MDDAVDERYHAGGVREHLRPFGERTARGERQALGLVAAAHDLEEQIGVPVAVGEVTELDELGYLTLKPEQTNAFFRLMDSRYGRASTIITTNLDTPSWYELFPNKPLVDALLDRLQHHCITIRIQGPSLRSPASAAAVPPDPFDAGPRSPKTRRRSSAKP